MDIDDKVKQLLDKVNSGKLNEYLYSLDGSDFGLYIPVYVDGDTVRLMKDGYSQTETNLRVTVNKVSDGITEDAQVVGWMGNVDGKDSSCSHGGTKSCKHCTSHKDRCRHCTGHKNLEVNNDLIAPELDYDSAIEQLKTNYAGILNSLAKEEFGLALLHGHNNEFTFTKLPEEYVSVVSNGVTTFRTETEVKNDPTFVPNMWRFINGELLVAGGYSQT